MKQFETSRRARKLETTKIYYYRIAQFAILKKIVLEVCTVNYINN